jgi:hypothetical protein
MTPPRRFEAIRVEPLERVTVVLAQDYDAQIAALRERMARAERLLFSRGGMSNPTHREQAVDAARALLALPAGEGGAGDAKTIRTIAGGFAAQVLRESYDAGHPIEIPSLGVTLRKSDEATDQQQPGDACGHQVIGLHGLCTACGEHVSESPPA